jgi:hypothetical protein
MRVQALSYDRFEIMQMRSGRVLYFTRDEFRALRNAINELLPPEKMSYQPHPDMLEDAKSREERGVLQVLEDYHIPQTPDTHALAYYAYTAQIIGINQRAEIDRLTSVARDIATIADKVQAESDALVPARYPDPVYTAGRKSGLWQASLIIRGVQTSGLLPPEKTL